MDQRQSNEEDHRLSTAGQSFSRTSLRLELPPVRTCLVRRGANGGGVSALPITSQTWTKIEVSTSGGLLGVQHVTFGRGAKCG